MYSFQITAEKETIVKKIEELKDLVTKYNKKAKNETFVVNVGITPRKKELENFDFDILADLWKKFYE